MGENSPGVKYNLVSYSPNLTYNKYSAGQRSWTSKIPPLKETMIRATSTRSAKDQRMRNATCIWSIFILHGFATSESVDKVMIWFDVLSINCCRAVSSL